MTDRHVNPAHGSTTNSGAGGAGAPWTTISYAVGGASALAAGDTIYVHTATYNERIVWGKSGTAGNIITITAFAGDTPILAGSSAAAGILVIPNGMKYITVGDGLHFEYGHAAPGGNHRFSLIEISGADTEFITCQNFTLERNYSTDLEVLAVSVWQEFGITVSDATDCLIDGVTIRGVCKGVNLTNQCMRCTVQHCDIGYTVQSNIIVGASANVERGIVIYHNSLHHAAREDGIQLIPPNGLSDAEKAADNSNRGTLILYNDFYEHGENGIDLKSAHHVVIEGNRFRGIAGSNDGFHPDLGLNRNSQGTITAGAGTYSEYVIIRNNIFYDCSSGIAGRVNWKAYNNTFVYLRRDYLGSGSTLGKSTALYQSRSSQPPYGIRNNICSANEFDVDLLAGQNQPGNECDLNGNLYASNHWNDSTSGNDYPTLAGWKTRLGANNWRFGKDGNSISVANHAAVKFVSVPANPTSGGTYDFSLQADSPAKGLAAPLTLTNGSGTGGTVITVDDASWFSNIFGRTDIHVRDRIFLNGQERTITAVNDVADTITVNAATTWTDNQPIYYILPTTAASASPDAGALDYLVGDGGGDPPPPPPGGPAGRSVTRAALNTTTGNQTFTFATPLTAQPIAWRFTVTEATADDTPADGAILARGWAWDSGSGIVEGASGSRSRHGQASSSTSYRTLSDCCIFITQHGSTTIDGQASFVSGDTSGVTLNITDAFSAAFLLTVEAFTATSAWFGTVAIQQTVDTYTTVTPGFTPNYIEVATQNRPIPASGGAVRLSRGFATYAASTITQSCMILSERNAVSPTQICAQIRNDYVGGDISDATGALLNGLQISDMGATDFRLNTKAGAHSQADAEAFVFCLEFGQDVYSGVVTTPTATNSAYDYAIGFAPASADVLATNLTAVNTATTDGTAGAMALGAWDGTNQYSNSVADEDAIATSNTQSQTDDRFVNLDKHDGSAGHVAAIVGGSTSDLQLNHSVVTGAANKWILVAIGEPFVATVDADFSGTPLTGIEPVDVVFTDLSTADGTTITTHAWDFGDGGTSTATNPTHTYASAGSYSVTLTVSDGTATDTLVKSDYVVISEPPDATLPVTSLVLASSIPEPVQAYNNVLASVEVIP